MSRKLPTCSTKASASDGTRLLQQDKKKKREKFENATQQFPISFGRELKVIISAGCFKQRASDATFGYSRELF